MKEGILAKLLKIKLYLLLKSFIESKDIFSTRHSC